MLHREIIAVCSQIHTKHINTLCGQNVSFFVVLNAVVKFNRWILKAKFQPDHVLHEINCYCPLDL